MLNKLQVEAVANENIFFISSKYTPGHMKTFININKQHEY